MPRFVIEEDAPPKTEVAISPRFVIEDEPGALARAAQSVGRALSPRWVVEESTEPPKARPTTASPLLTPQVYNPTPQAGEQLAASAAQADENFRRVGMLPPSEVGKMLPPTPLTDYITREGSLPTREVHGVPEFDEPTLRAARPGELPPRTPGMLERAATSLGVGPTVEERARRERERELAKEHFQRVATPEEKERVGRQRVQGQAIGGFADAATLGLGPAIARTLGLEPDPGTPESTAEGIAKGAGHLAGFLTLPVQIGRAVTAKTVEQWLAPAITDSTRLVLAKQVAHEMATLGTATTVAATGKAIEQPDALAAGKEIGQAARDGTALGFVFGGVGGMIPAGTLRALAARYAVGLTAVDLISGQHPMDDRQTAQKVFDYGLNAFFLFHGKDPRRVLDTLRAQAERERITEDDVFRRYVERQPQEWPWPEDVPPRVQPEPRVDPAEIRRIVGAHDRERTENFQQTRDIIQREGATPETIPEVEAAPAPKPAPVEWYGWQEGVPGRPPLAQWTLLEDVPGHPKGSTVGPGVLRELGFDLPNPPENPSSGGERPGAPVPPEPFTRSEATTEVAPEVTPEADPNADVRAEVERLRAENARLKGEPAPLSPEASETLDLMYTDLAGAERGQKIKHVETTARHGKREVWISQPSTFPDWLPTPYRLTKALPDLLTAIDNVQAGTNLGGKWERIVRELAERPAIQDRARELRERAEAPESSEVPEPAEAPMLSESVADIFGRASVAAEGSPDRARFGELRDWLEERFQADGDLATLRRRILEQPDDALSETPGRQGAPVRLTKQDQVDIPREAFGEEPREQPRETPEAPAGIPTETGPRDVATGGRGGSGEVRAPAPGPAAPVDERAREVAPEPARPPAERVDEPPASFREGDAPFTATPFPAEREPAPTFFSALRKKLVDSMPPKAPAPAIRNLIRSGGVKDAEISWTGIEDFLAQQGTRVVTKEDVLRFLDENEVKVEEVVKGGPTEFKWETAPGGALYVMGRASIERLPNGLFRLGMLSLQPKTFETMEEAKAEAEDTMRRVSRRGDETKFSRYTLPGAEPGSYRELLLTMPFETGKQTGRWEYVLPDGTRRAAFNEADARKKAAEVDGTVRPVHETYRSPHWDEPNVLAHLRFDERRDADGKRVMHIAEIQSDWAQQGRKQGFAGESPDEQVVQRWLDEREGSDRTLKARNVLYEDLRRWGAPAEVLAAKRALVERPLGSDIPPMPLAKTWPETAFRRAVRWAAENGFDRVTWDRGDVQNERYDLSKHVDAIRYQKNLDGTYDLDVVRDGRSLDVRAQTSRLTESKLADVVGKDVAEKIVRGEGAEYVSDTLRDFFARGRPVEVYEQSAKNPQLRGWGIRYASGQSMGTWPSRDAAMSDFARQTEMFDRPTERELSGLDLKVGGEGMRGFYDKILVDYANKFGKRWGVRVGTAEIKTYRDPDDRGAPSIERVHAFPISPEMRRSVLSEGVALFERRRRYTPRQDATPQTRKDAEQLFLDLQGFNPGPLSTAGGTLVREGRAPRGITRGLGFTAEAISKELAEKGHVNFRGQVVSSPEDLAVLAQPLRNPKYETFRLFFVQGDRIVGQRAVTSYLPDAVEVMEAVEWTGLAAEMRALGADGFYMMHNHPTGDPTPSGPDRAITQRFRNSVSGFRGHVVINSGTYGVIDVEGRDTVHALPGAPLPDAILRPSLPHRLLGERIESPGAVAFLGMEMKSPEGWAAIFYHSGAEGRVRAVQEVPVADLVGDLPRVEQWLHAQHLAFGSSRAFVYVENASPEVIERGRMLVRSGHLGDFVWAGAESAMARANLAHPVDRYAVKPEYRRSEQIEETPPGYRAPESSSGGEETRPERLGTEERPGRSGLADERGFWRPFGGRDKWTPEPGTVAAEIEAMNRRADQREGFLARVRGAKDATIEALTNKFHLVGVELRRSGVPAADVDRLMKVLELTGNVIHGQTESWAIRLGDIYAEMLNHPEGLRLRRARPGGRDLTAAWNDYMFIKQSEKRIRDLSSDPESNVSPEGHRTDAGQERLGGGVGGPRYVNPLQLDTAKAARGLEELRRGLTNEEWRAVERAAQATWRLNREMLDEAHRAGIVSDEAYETIIGRGDDYVPFQVLDYLVESGESQLKAGGRPISVKYQDFLRGVVGTERDVRNVIDSSMDKAARTLSLVNRNLAAKALIDLGERFPGVVEKVPGDTFLVPGEKDVISVFRDGHRENYAVQKDIARAMKFLNAEQMGKLGEILSKMATPLRAGATGVNLGFGLISNPPRDYADAWALSKYGMGPKDWVRGIYSAYKKDALYHEALQSGALFTFQRATTPDAFIRQAAGLPRKPYETAGEAILKSPRDILRFITEHAARVVNLTETGTKLASYQRGLRQGDTGLDLAYEISNYGGSPNFGRGGTLAREMSALEVFYNARMQGTARAIRRYREMPSALAKQALVRTGIYVVMPTLIAWAFKQMYLDEDKRLGIQGPRYDDAEGQRNWQLPLGYTYQGSDGYTHRAYVKIAKSETAQALAGPVEAALEYLAGHDAPTAKKLALDALGNVSPIPFDIKGENPNAGDIIRGVTSGVIAGANPVIRLPLELRSNENTRFQSAIVPRSLSEHAMPEDQVKPTSSPTVTWLARSFAKAGLPEPFSNPIKLEYAITSGTGGLGQSVIDQIDKAQGKELPETVGGYERAARLPALSRLLGKSGGTEDRQAEERFYRLFDEAQRLQGSLKILGEGSATADTTRQRALVNDPGVALKVSALKDLRAISKGLGEIRKAQVYVTHVMQAPVEDKQKALKILADQRTALLKAFSDAEKLTDNFTKIPVTTP